MSTQKCMENQIKNICKVYNGEKELDENVTSQRFKLILKFMENIDPRYDYHDHYSSLEEFALTVFKPLFILPDELDDESDDLNNFIGTIKYEEELVEFEKDKILYLVKKIICNLFDYYVKIDFKPLKKSFTNANIIFEKMHDFNQNIFIFNLPKSEYLNLFFTAYKYDISRILELQNIEPNDYVHENLVKNLSKYEEESKDDDIEEYADAIEFIRLNENLLKNLPKYGEKSKDDDIKEYTDASEYSRLNKEIIKKYKEINEIQDIMQNKEEAIKKKVESLFNNAYVLDVTLDDEKLVISVHKDGFDKINFSTESFHKLDEYIGSTGRVEIIGGSRFEVVYNNV